MKKNKKTKTLAEEVRARYKPFFEELQAFIKAYQMEMAPVYLEVRDDEARRNQR